MKNLKKKSYPPLISGPIKSSSHPNHKFSAFNTKKKFEATLVEK
jgi:hypothetical protein